MSKPSYSVRPCLFVHPPASEERGVAAELLLNFINELPQINPLADKAAITTLQGATEFISAYLDRTRNSRTIFLAYSPENKPCGIVFWQNAGANFLISNLYVLPAHRKCGAGTLLLDAALKEIGMRYPRSRMNVAADALWTSYPLFKKFGFVGKPPAPPHTFESSLLLPHPNLKPKIAPVRAETKSQPSRDELTI